MKPKHLLSLLLALSLFACNDPASVPTCTNLQSFGPEVLSFPSAALATVADLSISPTGVVATGKVDRSRLHLSEFSAAGALNWTQTLSIDSGEPIEVLPVSAGGYLVGGRTKFFGSTTQFLAIRIDEDGEELWTSNFGGSSIDNAAGIEETVDGKYLMFGTTAVNDQAPRARFDLRLTCFNDAGTEEWTQTVNLTRDDNALSFVRPRQGTEKYWALASTQRENSIFQDLMLLEFSADGVEQSRRQLAITSTKIWEPGNFAPTSDGGAIIAISTREDDTQGVSSAGTLIKLTAEGTIEWMERYPAISGSMKAVVQHADGSYTFIGDKPSYRQNVSTSFIVNTTEQGTIRWCREFRMTDFGAVNDLIQLPDGGYLLTGYASSTADILTFQAWVLRLDENGLPLQ